jgi:hypothetical protein
MKWSLRQICTATLASLQCLLIYANVMMVVPVLPQYFRDNHIYSFIASDDFHSNTTFVPIQYRIYTNEALLNGLLFAAFPIGQLIIQPLGTWLIYK